MITGASSGIGRATAVTLAHKSHHIIAIARNKKKLEELKYDKNNIDIIVADLATEEGRAIVKDSVKDTKIDVLINNAGVMAPAGTLVDIGVTAWRHQIAVNVEAPLFLTKALLKNLEHGRVLNLTIYSSFNVNPGLTGYAVSKAALNMLTRYMQNDLKPYSIAAGLVLPGIVDTNIQSQLPQNSEMVIMGRALAKEGKLLPPSTVAKFLSWVILKTSDDAFSDKPFDIYEKWHQKYWNEHNIIAKPQFL